MATDEHHEIGRSMSAVWGDRPESIGRDLVEECEAFLTGRYVELLVERGASIPDWAWTNLLAHGTRHQLAHAPSLGIRGSRLRAWSDGRAVMAKEVLDYARTYPSLVLFQQAVVIPLELDLASTSPTGSIRPSTWMSILQARAVPPHRRRPPAA
jgi:hypothetical protein